MYCCNGILFNHESPRRGQEFVTRKITNGVARIKGGASIGIAARKLEAKARLGGHARDYAPRHAPDAAAARLDDYVVATGATHSVRDLCELAFSEADLDYKAYVKIDQAVYRPAEVDLLIGDASKAQSVLKWHPEVDFAGLIKEMVHADLAALGAAPKPEPILTRA